MNRTDWFLALITFFVAAITIELISGATSGIFRDIVGAVALFVIYGLLLYLPAQAVWSFVGE